MDGDAKQQKTARTEREKLRRMSTWDAIAKVYKEDGVTGLYAGMPAGLLGVASSNFAYFYWYSFLRGAYQRYLLPTTKRRNISTGWELLIGAAAAALGQMFTIPISVVITRQQTASAKTRRSLSKTWMDIVSNEGWTALWKGLKPSLVLVVNPSITYGVYERLKNATIHARGVNGKGQLSAFEVFILGAISKTLATIITYPYIMAKVRLQYRPEAGAALVHYDGAVDVLKKVRKADGLAGWYNVRSDCFAGMIVLKTNP